MSYGLCASVSGKKNSCFQPPLSSKREEGQISEILFYSILYKNKYEQIMELAQRKNDYLMISCTYTYK